MGALGYPIKESLVKSGVDWLYTIGSESSKDILDNPKSILKLISEGGVISALYSVAMLRLGCKLFPLLSTAKLGRTER